MDRRDIAEVLGLLSVGFPSFKVTPELIDGWASIVKDDDASEVRSAALAFVRGEVMQQNRAFAPSLAEILGHVEAVHSSARMRQMFLEDEERRQRRHEEAVQAEKDRDETHRLRLAAKAGEPVPAPIDRAACVENLLRSIGNDEGGA